MKKLILGSLCTLAAVSALAQGTINFNNYVGAGATVNALVSGPSGLLGNTFYGQLYAGATEASLSPIGVAVKFTTSVATSLPTGKINGGAVTATGLAGGTKAFVQLRAWDVASGTSYDAAAGSAAGFVGKSGVISITLGDPNAAPPTTPADLLGLAAFSVAQVPEPSTMALGLLGLGALMLRRRQ